MASLPGWQEPTSAKERIEARPSLRRMFITARALFRSDPEHVQNPLEIVLAVILDLDAAAFLAVLKNDVSGQVLLKAVLHVEQSRGQSVGRRPVGAVAGTRRAGRGEVAGEQFFGGADGEARIDVGGRLGTMPREVVAIGVVPQDLLPGVTLSDPVRAGLDEAEEAVLAQLRAWNIGVTNTGAVAETVLSL